MVITIDADINIGIQIYLSEVTNAQYDWCYKKLGQSAVYFQRSLISDWHLYHTIIHLFIYIILPYLHHLTVTSNHLPGTEECIKTISACSVSEL